MAKTKMPEQIKEVKPGDKLEFIRNTYDGRVWYNKGKIVEVLRTDANVALLAVSTPMRDIHKNRRADLTFKFKGFKFCRYIESSLLINNCRKIGGRQD